MSLEGRRIGANHHVFGDLRQARRLKPLLPFDLYQAQPASANIGEAAQVTKPRYMDAAVPGGGKDRLALESRDHLAIYFERPDAHAPVSAAAANWHRPAGQRCSRT